ncbi:UNKNOWN [Stylonychia lemnae]|uniref:Uncharacterized protein n=1 Tax=Stylonychia lemnae TaxID=5949 RepID=A0A077ZZC2_STYLE|nr:UNKNOWN [Stylonychia lemnae]|eukprot:CDW75275.1 UNKNOWN [Stylonychia lemnae]
MIKSSLDIEEVIQGNTQEQVKSSSGFRKSNKIQKQAKLNTINLNEIKVEQGINLSNTQKEPPRQKKILEFRNKLQDLMQKRREKQINLNNVDNQANIEKNLTIQATVLLHHINQKFQQQQQLQDEVIDSQLISPKINMDVQLPKTGFLNQRSATKETIRRYRNSPPVNETEMKSTYSQSKYNSKVFANKQESRNITLDKSNLTNLPESHNHGGFLMIPSKSSAPFSTKNRYMKNKSRFSNKTMEIQKERKSNLNDVSTLNDSEYSFGNLNQSGMRINNSNFQSNINMSNIGKMNKTAMYSTYHINQQTARKVLQDQYNLPNDIKFFRDSRNMLLQNHRFINDTMISGKNIL